MPPTEPKTTPLHGFHQRRGAKLVDFGGYLLPLQYEGGIIAEHKACREGAALFDVSHMGRSRLRGPGAAGLLVRFLPLAAGAMEEGAMRYALLLGESGGITDDLIATRTGAQEFLLVFNASRKAVDREVLSAVMAAAAGEGEGEVGHEVLDESHALLAVQGPAAEEAVRATAKGAAGLRFMQSGLFEASLAGGKAELRVSRCGYTGEDGFEVMAPAGAADALAEALCAAGAEPAGLGARDALRLEAGLPLYGHEMDEATSPLEAGLGWAVAKSLRQGGAYLGGQAMARAFAEPASLKRRRLGIAAEEGPLQRLPAREGAPLFAEGREVGVVTSGAFSPSLGRAVALALVEREFAKGAEAGKTRLEAEVRGRRLPFRAASLPFVAHRYKRAS